MHRHMICVPSAELLRAAGSFFEGATRTSNCKRMARVHGMPLRGTECQWALESAASELGTEGGVARAGSFLLNFSRGTLNLAAHRSKAAPRLPRYYGVHLQLLYFKAMKLYRLNPFLTPISRILGTLTSVNLEPIC